jgi:hypothetical protein
MISSTKKNPEWYVIVIYDPLFLPGTSIHKVINVLLESLNVHFVLLSDLEGAGTVNLMNNDQISLIRIENFLEHVLFVEQFDWGDFFLFETLPDNWQTFKKKSYPEIISLTETTIRAVDDSYIYIYTPYDTIIELIKKLSHRSN